MKFTYIKDAGRFAWDEITNNFKTWFMLSLYVMSRMLFLLILIGLLGFIGYMLPIFRELGLYLLPCYFVVNVLQALSPVRDFNIYQLTCFYDMLLFYVSKVLPIDLIASCPGFESIRFVLLIASVLIVFGGFYWLFYELISYGFVVSRNALDMIEGKPLRLLSNRVKSHRFILGMVAFIALLILGIVLLVIPGIILSVRLSMFLFVLLDEGGTVRSAFIKSWNMTKGYFFMIFIVSVLYSILNWIPGIGLLLMLVPFVQLFYIGLYARLKHRAPEVIVEEIGEK